MRDLESEAKMGKKFTFVARLFLLLRVIDNESQQALQQFSSKVN